METKGVNTQSVFYLSSPNQLLLKLYWELDNLKNNLRNEDQKMRSYETAAYFAFNTAVTAWHLTDWTWQYLPEESQRQLAAKLGFKITTNRTKNLRSFQKAVMRESHQLEICREIANGSKHLATHKDAKVNTEAKVDAKVATAGELRAGQPLQTISYDFIVHWNNQTLRAVDVFSEALSFWHGLLANLGVSGQLLTNLNFDVKINRAIPRQSTI